MEIKSIYFLQPLVVEYEESGQLRESVILADMAREKIYQIADYDSQFVHGNKELISKVKEKLAFLGLIQLSGENLGFTIAL